jgi:hypothetical protein
MVAGEVSAWSLQTMSSPTPFFCDMTALTSEQRARHHELAALLQASLSGIREMSNGYDFEFPWSLDIYTALAEITPLEHACCPFLISAFELRVKATSSAGG